MSFLQILSGDGQYRANINSDNQLLTYTESVPSEGVRAVKGESFIISAKTTTAATPSGGLLVLTNNDVNYDIEVTRIYMYSHVITPTDLIVTQIFDPVVSNGTDVSSTAIINKNRGSANTLTASVVISDASSDVTFSSGTEYHWIPVDSMSTSSRNMNGTNILPKGKSIAFGYETVGGGNATDGEVIAFSINIIKRKRA